MASADCVMSALGNAAGSLTTSWASALLITCLVLMFSNRSCVQAGQRPHTRPRSASISRAAGPGCRSRSRRRCPSRSRRRAWDRTAHRVHHGREPIGRAAPGLYGPGHESPCCTCREERAAWAGCTSTHLGRPCPVVRM
jgi:hypothetical protein